MNPPERPRFPSRVVASSDRKSISDLVAFSHLRWDFVFQRPQHLMTRAARDRRVFFIEEPVFDQSAQQEGFAEIRQPHANLHVVVPHLPRDVKRDERDAMLRSTLDMFLHKMSISMPVLWYWTPMALPWSRHVRRASVVFDCMDDLAGFAGAPAELRDFETELFALADLVFTGGISLFEAKRARHPNVHAFPSSVDIRHFARALAASTEPLDQQTIPHPRLGFFGVLDERLDLPLLDEVARRRPDWQLVMIGPTAKIDPVSLPKRPNIHYLGKKQYEELPEYLAGWKVALLPFAKNSATRFISPTKTPEYLAAGRPVVSTSIRDVVRPYGELGLAHIADDPGGFVTAIEEAMREDPATRLCKANDWLAGMSWDNTWTQMSRLVAATAGRAPRAAVPSATVRSSSAHLPSSL